MYYLSIGRATAFGPLFRQRSLRYAPNAEAALARISLVFLVGVAGIAFAAIFIRLALPASPVVTGFYRMLIASALVGAALWWRGEPLRLSRRSALLAAASGLCFGGDIALWNTAVVTTSVANAALLLNTTPIYVGLWSVLVLRERLRPALRRRRAAGAGGRLAAARHLLGRNPAHPGRAARVGGRRLLHRLPPADGSRPSSVITQKRPYAIT